MIYYKANRIALLLGIFTLFSRNHTDKEYEVSFPLGAFVRPPGVNPVIDRDTTSLFYCPMNEGDVHWEEGDVFNSGAVVKEGKINLLYRAEDNSAVGIGSRVSRIGLAESSDGYTMKKRDTPVIFPGNDNNKKYEWPGGCEDRLVVKKLNGKNKEGEGDPDYAANAYCAGQALFDKNDPALLGKRLDQPFLFPEEEFEKNGQYPGGTVFIEGLVYFQKKWFLYYGCADSKVAVAVYE